MFSSLFNTTNQDTIKRIQTRYDNASKQLIAFQSSCPASIKNEYKESIMFIEERVSSLLTICNTSKKRGLNTQQLDKLSLDSLSMESELQVRLTFLKTKVHLQEYTTKAQALVAKGNELKSQRQNLSDLPIHFWLSDDIMRKEFSIQETFLQLKSESDKLQTYNAKRNDMWLMMMGKELVAQMDKNIKELETFCKFQEISITQLPDMNKKLLEALGSINEVSRAQENPEVFVEAHKNMLANLIKMLDQTRALDLSPLDDFIADLKKKDKEVAADALGVSLSPRHF